MKFYLMLKLILSNSPKHVVNILYMYDNFFYTIYIYIYAVLLVIHQFNQYDNPFGLDNVDLGTETSKMRLDFIFVFNQQFSTCNAQDKYLCYIIKFYNK